MLGPVDFGFVVRSQIKHAQAGAALSDMAIAVNRSRHRKSLQGVIRQRNITHRVFTGRTRSLGPGRPRESLLPDRWDFLFRRVALLPETPIAVQDKTGD